MPPVTIEHTTRRTNGSIHRGPSGTEYHFKPRGDDPRHVAEVENAPDVARFEQIARELGTFRVVSGDVGAAGGGGAELGPAAGRGAIPPEPEPEPVAPVPAGTEGIATMETMEESALRALYEAEIGRKPHHKALPATLIAQIRQARVERAG